MQVNEFCEANLSQDDSEKVATLYWLHLIDHTDIFTQGYVGVTTRSIDTRFKEHCNKFKSSYNLYSPLHQALTKYGIENIVKTRLYICSVKEAYELEKLFRPFEYMGWNTVEGGKLPSSVIDIIRKKRKDELMPNFINR